MDFDFNLILVPLTIGLGLIWLLDKLALKQRKTRGHGKESLLVRWAYDFFPVLAVVLVVRSFLIEPFNIPSSSMVPTLYTGDFIAVNKYAYGVRLPLTYNKVLDTGSPEHGDVIVFRYPENPSIYYIKRVIGLPGDTVSYSQGQLAINDVPVDTKPVNFDANHDLTAQLYPAGQVTPSQVLTESEATQMGRQEEEQAQYFQETQGENKHLVRYLSGMNSSQYAPFLQQQAPEVVSSAGTEWRVTVPADEYFVMGDNRDRSADGRFWGFVPDENLAGKAVYIWMHKPPGLNLPTFARNGSID
ncbi:MULTISPECIES: signal peptidase I [unclassified Psychrobacter]|uniref:signal peptidase I n=1 Tax=unclassified Psychrobacter TaxID=196806 RepID=UPI00071E6BE8|nr:MULTISPECIES: signal peptidase I [unclassified Psychrobacter]OLF37076.1 signal peptidase I [Psychrobacter sp. Cmf 22.2]